VQKLKFFHTGSILKDSRRYRYIKTVWPLCKSFLTFIVHNLSLLRSLQFVKLGQSSSGVNVMILKTLSLKDLEKMLIVTHILTI
jgi:hypothetical protein